MKKTFAQFFIPILVLISFPHSAHSQTATQAWVQRYHGLNDVHDFPLATSVDSSGNVFVTGYASDTFAISDWVTVAYSSAGVPLWTNRYNGSGDFDDQPNGITVDSAGNVFVAGVSFTSGTGQDFVTIKYSGAGMPLWTNFYNGAGQGNDGVNAVAVESGGNVIVTGISVGTNGLSSYYDFATVKYSGAGMPLWTNRYNGPANNEDGATDLALDSSGNVFVTGNAFTSEGTADFLTIAYSSSGVPLWTNRFDGIGNNSDYARAVAVDGGGNVLVLGDSWNGSAQDFVTIRYSAAGVPLWTNRYHGAWTGNNLATDMAVDSNGNVFVTGRDGGFGSTNGGYVTIKYSSAGTPLWTNHYNGSVTSFGYHDNARAVAVDGTGNVIVTGQSLNETFTSDYVTIAYSNDGFPLWTNRYDGPANGDDVQITKHSLALGPNGSVYVTGGSDSADGEGITNDFVTIKYTASMTAPFLHIVRSNAFAIISWPLSATGFLLEKSLTATGSWSQVSFPYVTNGTEISVSESISTENRFYRLRQP